MLGHRLEVLVRKIAMVSLWVVTACLLSSQRAAAQHVDLTLFLGQAYPVYDEHLTLSIGTPSIPGVDVEVIGSPELRTDGGLVYGGALAIEAGVVAIEGRLDFTHVGFVFTGAEYDLQGIDAPFDGLSATLIAEPGRFDADRIALLSINARIRTPGPVGIFLSGGFSYLPDITIRGTVPVSAELAGFPFPILDANLRLSVTPEESGHRTGINAGGGLRIGGGRVALVAEARVFYFGEYEMRFGLEDEDDALNELLEGIPPVTFRPVFVNAQAGLVFTF